MDPALDDKPAAEQYLTKLLNKSLHVHIADGRKFVGQLKCTDNARNIILAMTQEYRLPTARETESAKAAHELTGKSTPFVSDLKRRFVGLVVVPGQYITKIEVEN